MPRDPASCYNPSLTFKPQWAYETPDGYRDEVYLVPFTFTVLANGLPVFNLPLQLDDDVPYVLYAIVFPVIGPSGDTAGLFFPGLARIRDTHGNPLSFNTTNNGLIYTLGALGASGLKNENAFGFVFEPGIECAPGGTLLFDFQLSSSGSAAQFLDVVGAGSILFFAAIFGAAGNAFSIELIDPGAPNVALSVALVGTVVEVTLGTDGGSAIISTLAEVAAIINSTPAVAAVMGAVVPAVPATVATALGVTPLTGGLDGSVQVLNGTLIGVKRWKECAN